MFSFVRSLIIALIPILVMSIAIAPISAEANITSLRLDHGLAYDLVMPDGHYAHLVGNGEYVKVALIRGVTSAAEGDSDSYFTNAGDPELSFYVMQPVPSAIRTSWRSSESISPFGLNPTQLRLNHGLVYSVVMSNGIYANLLGDGDVYPVVLIRSITPATDDHVDTFIDSHGDGDINMYPVERVTAELRESLQSH